MDKRGKVILWQFYVDSDQSRSYRTMAKTKSKLLFRTWVVNMLGVVSHVSCISLKLMATDDMLPNYVISHLLVPS